MTEDLQSPFYHSTDTNLNATQFQGANATPSGSLGIIARFPSPPPSEIEIPADILRFALQNHAAHLMPKERVGICLKRPIPAIRAVKIMYSPEVEKAHYKNLQVCGSVWMCTVCATKITERRREELAAALAASDFQPYLITYTLRHHAGDRLKDLLSALMAAFDSFKSGVSWQRARRRYGWIGSIRSTEVTHGLNGWHPHLHDLVLLEKPLEPAEFDEFEAFLKRRWIMVLQRHGRDAEWYPSVNVKTGDNDVAAYLAKYGKLPTVKGWTLEHELTKAPVKKAHKDGRTAFQLLADSMMGDKAAGKLFREYARCFKGKKQLVWSKGLRALLGLTDQEMTDAEIAAENREPAFVLLFLNLDQWKVVVYNDLRAELLQEASFGDRERVVAWLADLGIYVYDNAHFDALIPLGGGIGIGLNEDF